MDTTEGISQQERVNIAKEKAKRWEVIYYWMSLGVFLMGLGIWGATGVFMNGVVPIIAAGFVFLCAKQFGYHYILLCQIEDNLDE